MSKKKEEKERGKAHDHLDQLPKQRGVSQFAKKEKFYHFGKVSIDYNGRGQKNCELHIIADGSRLYTFDFVAKKGRDFNISRQWLMAKNAKVIVTRKNRRETLFNINVPSTNARASNAKEITKTSGHYTIEFRVFKNTVYKNRIQYQHALFKNSKRPSAWKNVAKKKLLDDLEETTADPREVNQEAAGFCGATAIGYAMATSQPHRLIQFCQELYENGSMRGAEKTFRASSKFRNSLVPGSQNWTLSLTDYLFTGTLMEDAGFKKQEYREKLKKNKDGEWEVTQDYNKEGSMTGAQKRWSRELLGYHNDRGIGDKFPLGKQINALVECNRVLRAKGFVFPNINADILKERTKRSVVKMPNHWVTMTDIEVCDRKGKKLTLTDSNIKKVDEVKPTFFTWGKYYTGQLEKKHYKKFVWLYIVCEPFTNRDVIEQLKKVS